MVLVRCLAVIMKLLLLLISLASLLLYTSVFAHPSKRQLEPKFIHPGDAISGSEDVDDWVEMMEEECGMKMEQLDKLEAGKSDQILLFRNFL